MESYVEHIRQLSDEREALIHELETENEALKLQVVTLEHEGRGQYCLFDDLAAEWKRFKMTREI